MTKASAIVTMVINKIIIMIKTTSIDCTITDDRTYIIIQYAFK